MCREDRPAPAGKHYQRIADAIYYYVEHHIGQPSLSDVAARANLSPGHFQRIFTQWVGISPAQFLQFLTKEAAIARLRKQTVFDTSITVGLSSPSRLYDLLINWEGVTPGDVRRAGDGMAIQYGLGDSPFGPCFVAVAEKGICKLSFLEDEEHIDEMLAELFSDWPKARLEQNSTRITALIGDIFAHCYSPAHRSTQGQPLKPLRLLLRGTPFQQQVWQALLAIAPGDCWSYRGVAAHMGKASATRAVASAIAKNPVGYLIPCHRVIRESGAFNQYRWGAKRKAMLLGWEAARAQEC